MLVLTNTCLETPDLPTLLEQWPGLHVLISLPQGSTARKSAKVFLDRFIVVEWLQPPNNSAIMLADLFQWINTRRDLDSGPLLYLNQPLNKKLLRAVDENPPPYTVEADFGPDGGMTRLSLGEMIATSPLLPGMLDLLAARDVADATMIDLISEEMAL